VPDWPALVAGDASSATYLLADMADDTVRLLDHLGIGAAHVVGASLGGMICQAMAYRYPERVASLVSVMSSTGNPDRRIAFGSPRALRAITQPPPASREFDVVIEHLMSVFRAIGSPGYPQDPVVMRPHFERVVRAGLDPDGSVRQLLAILASGDRRALLRQVKAPTLVIHGAADPLVPPAAGLDTARCIPGARFQLIDGMGHDFPPALQPVIARAVGAHCRAVAC
jgi:pimeloyl-ACP methyl ester carboxylesterase